MNELFKNITGYDIGIFFDRFTSFVTNYSQTIINYFSGLESVMDRKAYDEYNYMMNESLFVINLFDLNQERFNTVDFWQLMEFCDDIRIKLETIGNFSKYSRSSVDKESFTSDIVVPTILRADETIEELVSRYGSTDGDTDWVEAAISNAIIQEDYNLNGGKVINLTFKNNSKFFIQSVLDNPEGDKIKGKDIYRKLTFEDNDIKVLGYDDTLQQNLDILLSLKKNDNPEFPADGIDKTLIVGMSMKAMLLPSLLRQLYQTISTDDLISKIEVINTSFDQDSMYMDVNISVKSGEERQMVLNI